MFEITLVTTGCDMNPGGLVTCPLTSYEFGRAETVDEALHLVSVPDSESLGICAKFYVVPKSDRICAVVCNACDGLINAITGTLEHGGVNFIAKDASDGESCTICLYFDASAERVTDYLEGLVDSGMLDESNI